MPGPTIAVLDVDGTLVDSNYQHALAWYRALRSLGETFPVWRIDALLGMGGRQLVAARGDAVPGERVAGGAGDRWVEDSDRLVDEVAPRPGAREVLIAVKGRGHRLVLA